MRLKLFCVAVFYIGTIVKMKAISHTFCFLIVRIRWEYYWIFVLLFRVLERSELREWVKKMWKWSIKSERRRSEAEGRIHIPRVNSIHVKGEVLREGMEGERRGKGEEKEKAQLSTSPFSHLSALSISLFSFVCWLILEPPSPSHPKSGQAPISNIKN